MSWEPLNPEEMEGPSREASMQELAEAELRKYGGVPSDPISMAMAAGRREVELALRPQVIAGRIAEAEAAATAPAPSITPRRVPKRQDTWTRAILAAIDAFEQRQRRTPTLDELWLDMIEHPPTRWRIEWVPGYRWFTYPGATHHLEKRDLRKRLARLYPVDNLDR
jgi:hypothetical protein